MNSQSIISATQDQHQPAHYSHSSASQARNCARQYYYRKVRGIPESPKTALIIGHIVDHTCNAILQGIINDDPVADPEALAVMITQTELSLSDAPEDVSTEVHSFLTNAIKEKAFSAYRMMIDFQPEEVQRECRLWINGMETPILMFLDVQGSRKRKPLLIDNKTAARKPSNGDNYRDQMSLYAAWYYKMYGVLPETEALVLVKTKNPYWMRLPVEVSWQHISLVLDGFWQHDALVKRGQYHANRNSMFCSQKNCSYWDICHEEMDRSEEAVAKRLTYAEG